MVFVEMHQAEQNSIFAVFCAYNAMQAFYSILFNSILN